MSLYHSVFITVGEKAKDAFFLFPGAGQQRHRGREVAISD